MIVDSHVYCFPPVDSPAGYESGPEHLRRVQASHAGHHQPAWRVRDREPASSRELAPDGGYDASHLPDVDFRVDRLWGRVVWTVDGEDYTKQLFPPDLRGLEFTPHSLVAEMDYAGVDAALVHTDPMLGRDSEYLAECVRLYPDRLRAMAPVDEWRILTETDAVIRELADSITGKGLHVVKFHGSLSYLGGAVPWFEGAYAHFWDAATSLGVPVFFTLGSGMAGRSADATAADRRAAYLQELRVLIRWMERYPDTVCSITHGFPWRDFLEAKRIELPEAIWEPFGNPNLSLEVCFPVRVGDLFDYPYREVLLTLETLVERIGADRLVWGTDMPFQNRFCTYRQSRDWIERYCTFLSRRDKEMIMGGTARRVLGLGAGARR